MKASIYEGTEYEISWTIENHMITPDLVERIEDAGKELDINWMNNEFYPAVELLLEHYTKEEIEAKIYDEDPDMIELIKLAIQHPLDKESEDFEIFVRLYLPVVLVILNQVDTQ